MRKKPLTTTLSRECLVKSKKRTDPIHRWLTRGEAKVAAKEALEGTPFLFSFRLLSTRQGWCVQLYEAGPYLGTKLDPKTHVRE